MRRACSMRRCARFLMQAIFNRSSYGVDLLKLSRVLRANAFVDSSLSVGPLLKPIRSRVAYSKWGTEDEGFVKSNHGL